MWLGIPWWVWVFVGPEVLIALVGILFILPAAGVRALLERLRSGSSQNPDAIGPTGGNESFTKWALVVSSSVAVMAAALVALVLISPGTVGLARADEVDRLEQRTLIAGPRGPAGVNGLSGPRGPRGPRGVAGVDVADDLQATLSIVQEINDEMATCRATSKA